jgi:histidine triad (HIT) family protein
MDEAHYLGLMHFARKVAALEKAVPAKGMAVVGLKFLIHMFILFH